MDKYTPQFWVAIVQLVQFVGNCALVVYIWLSNRQKATVAQIKAVAQKVDLFETNRSKQCEEHKSRTTSIEVSIEKSPTHKDIGEVHDRITAVKGGVDELNGLIKGMRDNVNLLVKHHMGETK